MGPPPPTAARSARPGTLRRRSQRPTQRAPRPGPAPQTGPAVDAKTAPTGRPLATPSTRGLARRLGVDLHTVSGSGPGGRILNRVVTAANSATTTPPVAVAQRPPPRPSGQHPRRVRESPCGVSASARRRRRRRGRPCPASDSSQIDVADLFALREQFKPLAVERGVSLTLTASLRRPPRWRWSSTQYRAVARVVAAHAHLELPCLAMAGGTAGCRRGGSSAGRRAHRRDPLAHVAPGDGRRVPGREVGPDVPGVHPVSRRTESGRLRCRTILLPLRLERGGDTSSRVTGLVQPVRGEVAGGDRGGLASLRPSPGPNPRP